MAFFSATRAATRSPFLTSRNTISRSILPTFRSLSISSPAYNKPPRVESDLTHPALLKDPPISNPSSETDPWSLVPPPPPEAPTGMEGMTIEELIASPHPEGRDSESTETLRKRLVYESRKRGILETDLILATFAMERLGSLTDRELREYDRFLTLPDWSIYYYTTNKADAPEPWASSWILAELIEHAKNKARTVRRMPGLEESK